MVVGVLGLTPGAAFAAGNQVGHCVAFVGDVYSDWCTTSPAVQANASGHYLHISTGGAASVHYWLTVRESGSWEPIWSQPVTGNVNFWLNNVYSTYVAQISPQYASDNNFHNIDLWIANY